MTEKTAGTPRTRLCFAWLPTRAWYHQEYQWVWLKWYRTNWGSRLGKLDCSVSLANAVAEFEP